MKKIIIKCMPVIDIISLPFVLCGGVVLKFVRKAGLQRLPLTKKLLYRIGVFPIIDHYYEPLFNMKKLKYSLRADRSLPGIDINEDEQVRFLSKFHYADELKTIPEKYESVTKFWYGNGSYSHGDAEYFYSLIRLIKPSKIIEIGSGSSTKIALMAVEKTKEEDPEYSCDQVCIEPYEQPWLEQLPVTVLREKLEDVDYSLFEQLNTNDILFIDSSHIIRPQGDVLKEYLEILPRLKAGVYVHVHDVFTPKDYKDDWIYDEVKLWNEQYLLEAFLTGNKNFRIIGALNFLKHKHYDLMKEKFPLMTEAHEPGAFWMQKVI